MALLDVNARGAIEGFRDEMVLATKFGFVLPRETTRQRMVRSVSTGT